MTDEVRHWPFKGHGSDFDRQLHVFGHSTLFSFCCKTFRSVVSFLPYSQLILVEFSRR